jgi:hypothetical protein
MAQVDAVVVYAAAASAAIVSVLEARRCLPVRLVVMAVAA